MSNALNYWPEDIATNLPASPIAILREAAIELGQATNGAVEAEVKLDNESSNNTQTVYDLILVSKALGFRYQLLFVYFDPYSFYPCNIVTDHNEKARDEAEMRGKLTEALRADRTVNVVKTLLAQAVAA